MRIHSPKRTAALVAAAALVLTGCSAGQPPVDSATQEPSDPPPASPGNTDLATATFETDWLDALDAAAARFAGDPVSLSLEWQNSAFAYGVELVSDTESYEATFNADTGELLFEQTEAESPAEVAEKRRGLIVPSDLIDPAKAMAAAVGAAPGTVHEWEIDDEEGRITYEVQIATTSGDVDVRVDAVSAEILEIDN